MSQKTLKLIAVDESNYTALKNLGRAGDSFNDVVTVLLMQSGIRKDVQCNGNVDGKKKENMQSDGTNQQTADIVRRDLTTDDR